MDPGFSPKTATIKVRENGGNIDPLFQASAAMELFFRSSEYDTGLIYISEEIWGTMINNAQPHLQDIAEKVAPEVYIILLISTYGEQKGPMWWIIYFIV